VKLNRQLLRSNSSPFGGILVNRELIEVFSEIAREKNVERSELGSIIEGLFLHMVERERGDASNCSVIVNLDKGEFEIYVEKTIVDDIDDPVFEITLEEVAKIDAEMAEDLEIGDSYVEIINPLIFGRRLINMAKQYFSQRLQDVEKKYIYEDYANRVGEIVIGTVHQVQRDNTFVNIEHAELRMPRNEQIKTERYRRGDSVRAIIKSVEITSRGPDIVVSRSDNHFLYKLFEMEVTLKLKIILLIFDQFQDIPVRELRLLSSLMTVVLIQLVPVLVCVAVESKQSFEN